MKDMVNVNFLGWDDVYAKFEITGLSLPNGKNLMKILVAHEGRHWFSSSFYEFYRYMNYEDVQADLGHSLTFLSKEYSGLLNRALFLYEVDRFSKDILLAVPATGDEMYFEIYGVDELGAAVLLHQREL